MKKYKIPTIVLLSIALLLSLNCTGQQYNGTRLWKIRSFTADSLQKTLEQELQFIDFQANDHVADIGTYDGYYPVVYSLFVDSIHFYLEDIKNEGFNHFDSLLLLATAKRNKPLTNTFKIVIGENDKTNLPEHFFDKIILRDMLHHSQQPAALLASLLKHLKSDGWLYLMEPIKTNTANDIGICNGAMTKNELYQLLDNQGFNIEKNEPFGKKHEWIAYRLKH